MRIGRRTIRFFTDEGASLFNVPCLSLINSKYHRAYCCLSRRGTDLGLGQHQAGGHLEPFGPREVLVLSELVLQLQQLLAGEGRSGPPSLAEQRVLGAAWGQRRTTVRSAAGQGQVSCRSGSCHGQVSCRSGPGQVRVGSSGQHQAPGQHQVRLVRSTSGQYQVNIRLGSSQLRSASDQYQISVS